jgi:hypothetical protein
MCSRVPMRGPAWAWPRMGALAAGVPDRRRPAPGPRWSTAPAGAWGPNMVAVGLGAQIRNGIRELKGSICSAGAPDITRSSRAGELSVWNRHGASHLIRMRSHGLPRRVLTGNQAMEAVPGRSTPRRSWWPFAISRGVRPQTARPVRVAPSPSVRYMHWRRAGPTLVRTD